MRSVLVLFFVCLISSSYSLGQVYSAEWAQSYGSGANEEIKKVVLDDNNNTISIIFFMDSTGLNIGGSPVTIVTYDWDYLLVKTDVAGNALWYHVYDNGHQLRGVNVSGNDIFVTGTFNGTMDLDPGPGTMNATSGGGAATFCQKFDSDGNLVWAKVFTGSGSIACHDIEIDDNGNVYLSGAFGGGSIDVNPGPLTVLMTAAPQGICLIKLDPLGNYLWHQAYQGTSNAYNYLTISANYVYLYGFYMGTYDFDPTAGVDNETAVGYTGDGYLNKIDASGNLIWSNRLSGVTGTGSWDRNTVDHVVVDDQENVYLQGNYSSNLDVDAGPGVTTIPGFCTDCARLYVAKWGPNGNYIWSYYIESTMGSSETLTPNGLAFNADKNNLLIGGYVYSYPILGTIDFIPGAGQFNETVGAYGGSFFVHLDTAGTFFWAEFRENQNTNTFDVNGDTIIVGGLFSDTQNLGTPQVPFVLTATPNTLFPFSYPDAYLAKLNYSFSGLSANVFTTSTSNIDSCDGHAFAYPIGGFPPYSYTWLTQTDADNLSDLDSACYGIHSLLIVDVSGDSTFVDYYVTDSSNYYNWSSGTISDTVYFVQVNCALDYSLPIDSASITDFDYLYDDTLSSGEYYYGEVTYYQGGNAYTFGDTVLVDFDQNVLFFLSVYCPSKLAPETMILLLTTNSLFANITGFNNSIFEVYPNPTNSYFNIVGVNYQFGVMTDLSGKVVKQWSSEEGEISTQDVNSGMYFITIFDAGELIGTKKLVVGVK